MIGNDIIDLELAYSEKKSENQRFRKKVFSKAENDLIDSTLNSELTLWHLWASKEAAYKLHQRKFQLEPKLNPLRIECCLGKSQRVQVAIKNESYSVYTKITSKYLYAEARLNKSYELFREIYKQPVNYHDYLKNFSEANNFKLDNLSLKKDQLNIPSIFNSISEKNFPISITHHGKFAAIVFPLINS